jgi:hypothetical protein
MRPSFIGSSPFQEEPFENYTIGLLHFPEDSGGPIWNSLKSAAFWVIKYLSEKGVTCRNPGGKER